MAREGVAVAELVHTRAELLGALDEPAEKPALTDDLPASRSTVDRAIRELLARSFVERVQGGYRTTLAGRLALTEHDRLASTLADAADARDLLVHLSPDTPLDPEFLRGAEVYYPEPPVPRRPLTELEELVESSDRFRGFTTIVLDPQFVETMRDLVLSGEVDLEFVFDESTASFLRAEYGDALDETLATDAYRMYVTDDVPYGFGILSGDHGRTAYLLVTGPNGEFRGLLLNDREPALEWAESLFERYRERATELTSV